ncbi:MAG: DNA sulfur modification protein DndB [Cyanobacteria bacterium J06635_13]
MAVSQSKSNELQRLRFTFNLIRQGKYRFYSLTLDSDLLARICFVTTREEDPKAGFQRVLDKKRAQEIANYIDSGLGTIPC